MHSSGDGWAAAPSSVLTVATVADPADVTAAPRQGAASPTAVPAPTYPMDVMNVPDFSPLEVETYFVEPVGTDMQVFYTIPADGWMSWIGAFKFGPDTEGPGSVVGFSILNVTNVVQDGCTGHVAVVPPVGPTVDEMATALAGLSPFVLTKPPSDVTIDGFRGKHLQLTVPDLELVAPERHRVHRLHGRRAMELYRQAAVVRQPRLQPSRPVRGDLAAGRRWHARDDRDVTSPGSSEGDIAELRSIFDSIDIIP